MISMVCWNIILNNNDICVTEYKRWVIDLEGLMCERCVSRISNETWNYGWTFFGKGNTIYMTVI